MATPPCNLTPPSGSVLLNIRLASSGLHKALDAAKIRVIPEDTLDLIDVIVSMSKTILYLANNDINGNFDSCKKKLAKFSKLSNKGIILFEMTDSPGNDDLFTKLQKLVVIDLRLKLLPFGSHGEAALLISHLINEETDPKFNPFLIKKKPDPFDPAMVSCLQQIPKLGAVRIKTLLQRYNTIANIARASEEELGDIIGKACGKNVCEFFHSKND